jgi:hypothetical protein
MPRGDGNDQVTAPTQPPSAAEPGKTKTLGSPGVVTLGRRKYAIGLVWQAVATPGDAPAAQARATAKRLQHDLICIRAGSQFALGRKGSGQTSGMRPLAAMVADSVDDSCVAAFEVPTGYYVVAVRDDQVLPGCDRLFDSKQDATDFFAELFYGTNWGQAIAPKDWAIENTTPTHVEETIRGVKTRVTLAEVSRWGQIIRLAGVAVILGLCAVLYHVHADYVAQTDLEQQQEQARLAKLAAERARQHPSSPPPWLGKAAGVPMMLECADDMLRAPMVLAGWTTSKLACVADNQADGKPTSQAIVTLTLDRNGGKVNWIPPSVERTDFKPQLKVSDAGAVELSWPVPIHAAIYDKDLATKSIGQAKLYLKSQFEEIYQDIEIKAEVPPSVAAPDPRTGKTRQVPAGYQDLAFSFKSAHDPKEFGSILATIPGLVIDSVRLDVAKWVWTVEGKVYEKLQPSPAIAK